MKYAILVLLLTTATDFIATIPIGGQHSAVYQEAHYRIDPPSRPSGDIYGSPPYSVVSEPVSHENGNKWLGSLNTKYAGGFQHGAQMSPWVKDTGAQDTQGQSQYWHDGERATWPKEEDLAEAPTYVHLYHLGGQGIQVPPNSGVLQDEWVPHSDSYHLQASLPQAYDGGNGRYGDVWNHGVLQAAYGGQSSEDNGGYWADNVNSGFVSSNEGAGSMYTEFFPDDDTWTAYGIDPDLVDLEPIEDVNAFLSELEQVNPVQEASTIYTDSVGGSPVAGISQQTTWGDGVSGESFGIGEWGSAGIDTELGSDTKTKGSRETDSGNLNVGSLGDGVTTTYIDSGTRTGDEGTGIEILGASKIVAGPTGDEFSSGSSDTMGEGLGDGIREVTGGSVLNNDAGADKLGTVGGTGDLKEDASASSMLTGGLGQYGSNGGAQRGTVTGRPTQGEWSGGSAMEVVTGRPSFGESGAASDNVVTEDNNAQHTDSGSSVTESNEPKGTEFGSSSATLESVIPNAGSVEGAENLSSVATGGLGDSSLGSIAVKEGASGPFDGYIKEAGGHVTSHGDPGDIGAAVESSGSYVGYDKGSHIGGGTGESSKASSSGVGASGGKGGKSTSSTDTVSQAGCVGNSPKRGDQRCKNIATGGTKAGSTGEKVTDVGFGSGSGHATVTNNANGRGRGGANIGHSGSGSGSNGASETGASNIKELVQPLLDHFSDSTVAVAEAFAGVGTDGKVQASSTAKVFDTNSKRHV